MRFIEVSPFVRFAYQIRLTSGRHTVARDMRLFYITDGEGTMTIDGTDYSFTQGTVMLWQAGSSYILNSPDIVQAISINFDYTSEFSHEEQPYPVLDALNTEGFLEFRTVTFQDMPAFNKPLVSVGNSAIYSILEKIIFESTSCQPYYRERVSALLKECLTLIARNVSMPKDIRSDSALETVMEYIHKNYAATVDNATLAQLVGYHPYYLNKLFLALNGVTLHRYVINYRLAVSEQLLLSSTASIDEIALSVGFSCALSFSSSFRKKNGMTPTEFRKRFS